MANSYRAFSFEVKFKNGEKANDAFCFINELRSKNEENWTGVCVELDVTLSKIFFYNEEESFEDGFVVDLCKVVKKFKLAPIVMETASWCDKPRTDQFGGDACLITANGVLWVNPGAIAAYFADGANTWQIDEQIKKNNFGGGLVFHASKS